MQFPRGKTFFAARLPLVMAALLSASAGASPAGLISSRSAKGLASEADTIVVASLIASATTGGETAFQVRVLRTLKGTASPGVVLHAVLPSAADGGVPSRGAPASIWFLKQSNGLYSLLPARLGDVALQQMALYVEHAVPTGVFAWSEAEDPLDKIAKEIGFFASRENYAEAEDAVVQSLQEIETPAAIAVFEALSQSPMASVRAAGLAALIERGHVNSLVQLERELSGPFASSAFLRGGGPMNLLAAIEFLYRNPDPAGIQVLGRLAHSASPIQKLARASVYALRSLHTRDTLPILVALMDSPEQAVRYDAVYGLSAFASGLPVSTPRDVPSMTSLPANVPGFDAFRADEARYIGFWKKWWLQNQEEIRVR